MVPNPRVVAIIQRLVCMPAEEKALFANLPERQAEEQGKKWLEQRYAELDKAVDGNRRELVRQLFHYSSLAATNMDQAMIAGVLIEQMKIPNDEIVSAMLPLLDSKDKRVRNKAANWLGDTDKTPDDKAVDFRRYESILLTNKPAIPLGLVRYLFDRAPRTALRTVVRVYAGEVSDAELTRRLDSLDSNPMRSSKKEDVEYFAARSEWWAQLFVAASLKEHWEDWTFRDQLLTQLKKSDHPLVREKVAEIRSGKR